MLEGTIDWMANPVTSHDSLVTRLGVQSDCSIHNTRPETAGILSLIHLDSTPFPCYSRYSLTKFANFQNQSVCRAKKQSKAGMMYLKYAISRFWSTFVVFEPKVYGFSKNLRGNTGGYPDEPVMKVCTLGAFRTRG